MQDKQSVVNLPVNRSPVAMHRRQMALQVWLPLAISILIVVTLIVLTIIGAAQGSPQIERWGNLSAVMIIIPVLLFGLVSMALVGAGVYGMSKLLKHMPDWMLRVQLRMIHIALAVRRAADTATKPVMKANTLSARVRALWDRFVRGKNVQTVPSKHG